MARKKKVYDDDDGRTIVDMSGVTRPNLLGIQPRYMDEPAPKREEAKPERPWEDDSIQRGERSALVGGAMKASLLIGGVYIGGFGLFIWLLTLIL